MIPPEQPVPDWLREDYRIGTPENVAFGYEVAGIGTRFIGALADSTLLAALLVAVNVLLLLLLGAVPDPVGDLENTVASSQLSEWIIGLVAAAYALLQFGLFWGYYICFEWAMHGQTPGKRLAGVRVVGVDGSPAGLAAIAIRNLVRVVDFLPLGYGLGVFAMLLNPPARRLGDYAAGTLVVREGEPVRLSDLVRVAQVADSLAPEQIPLRDEPAGGLTERESGMADRILAQFPAAAGLTAEDYRLVLDVLARWEGGRLHPGLAPRLAGVLAARIGAAGPSPDWAPQFLRDLALVYRRVNR